MKVGLRIQGVGTSFSEDEDGEAAWRSGPGVQAEGLANAKTLRSK